MSEAATDTPPTAAPMASRLDEIFTAANRSDAPGVVVGIARNGRPLYRRAFGLASVELGVANTPWTRMRIGSTSKHFTCLAALLLVEDGKLDLDVGVRRYLPELRELPKEPTLRQFMNHTSGLRDYLDVGFLASGLTIKPKGEALAVQVRQSRANFTPGEKMIYNNGAYQLLSLVIERVSGLQFEQFMKERVFEPLGMLDTASVPSDFEIHRGVATLHVPQPDGTFRRGIFPSEEIRGEGAMVSTIDDMLRWLTNLRGSDRLVGSTASWAQMTDPARLDNGLVSTYALGLMIEKYRGVEVIHHGGSVIGGSCQMLTVPAHELDIVIMCNGASVSVSELANKAVDLLLGDNVLTQVPDSQAATANFLPLVGTRYFSPSTGLVLGFGDAAGKLGFVIHNSPPIPVREEGDDLFLDFSKIAVGPFGASVQRLAAGAAAPDTLHVTEGGNALLLERLPDAAPTLEDAAAQLLGRYMAPDLKSSAIVEREAERLVMRIASEFGPNVLTLKPLSDDVIAWNFEGQLAPLGGTFVVERDAVGVTGLRANTLRTRHVDFRRARDRISMHTGEPT